MMLLALAHGTGWPVAEGGSARITDALAAAVTGAGGRIETGWWVRSLAELPRARAVLLDVAPRALLAMAGDRLPAGYRNALRRFRYGAGVCKADFALSGPVPWAARRPAGPARCTSAARSPRSPRPRPRWPPGGTPRRPYVLVTQPGVADPTRSPAGTHTLWAYCHVPAGSDVDMTARIEAQIERFAPGFRDLILARHVRTAADEEAANPNYVGGDIAAGMQTVWQTVARPVPRWNPYRTPLPGVYLCSSSTPPLPGVHGRCGELAALTALRDVFGIRQPPDVSPARLSPAAHGRRTAVTASRTARLPVRRLTAPRLTALLLAGLIVLLTGVVVAQSVTRHHTGSHRTAAEGTALVLALWAIAAVGLVVAWHQRANPIGWLLLAMPVHLLLTFASDSYDQAYRLSGPPARAPGARAGRAGHGPAVLRPVHRAAADHLAVPRRAAAAGPVALRVLGLPGAAGARAGVHPRAHR